MSTRKYDSSWMAAVRIYDGRQRCVPTIALVLCGVMCSFLVQATLTCGLTMRTGFGLHARREI